MAGSSVNGLTRLRGREEEGYEDETGEQCDQVQGGMRSCVCGRSAGEKVGSQYSSETGGQGQMLPEQKRFD
jgi:hypothetical protein